MDDWEAERRNKHQRNVSVILIVFFGLLYLSYKFDDDPPFKSRDYRNPASQPSRARPAPAPRAAILTRFVEAPMDPAEPATVQVDLSWDFPDGHPKSIGIEYWLYPNTQRGTRPYYLGNIPVLSSEHNSIRLPSELPPGHYMFTGRLTANGVVVQSRSFAIQVR